MTLCPKKGTPEYLEIMEIYNVKKNRPMEWIIYQIFFHAINGLKFHAAAFRIIWKRKKF